MYTVIGNHQGIGLKGEKGFTLIELSIVMVIIGLIISGILVGQDLIHGAEIRATISQIDKYNAANNAFRNRYTALPGDYVHPDIYISSACVPGNGDGLIGAGVNSAAMAGSAGGTAYDQAAANGKEAAEYWRQLSLLGMIEGTFDGTTATTTLGTNYPYTKINRGGIFGYGNTGDSINYFHVGLQNSPAATTTIGVINVLSPADAQSIDGKMDDGMPDTGIVVARGIGTGNLLESQASANASMGGQYCVNSTAATRIYNNSAGVSLLCQLRIRMN